MDVAKDLFFFIGSLLGIVAFLRGTADALTRRNREAWKHFRSMITEADLRSLEFQIEQARRVDFMLLSRLDDLVRAIEHDDENLRFGPLLRSRIREHLKTFARLYYDLRQFIQVPWWRPTAVEGAHDSWEFDKTAFFSGEYPQAGDYVEHLYGAADVALALRREYRVLSVLADLDPLELPLTSRLVQSRARFPEPTHPQER